jgi:nucleoside-diphosphate-sugar epimerase
MARFDPDKDRAGAAAFRHVVLGARGRLGHALISALGDQNVLAPERSTYQRWAERDGAAAVAQFFTGQRLPDRATIFIATGILDPGLPQELHHSVNVRLPENVILGTAKLNVRVVSFGSVMEQLLIPDKANAYIRSKITLGQRVGELAEAGSDAVHIRMHTLYGGGPPPAYMFTGQIRHAMQTDTVFAMTGGNQLREYHHVGDECRAIVALAANHRPGIATLSHGAPIRLKDMAEHVFKAFGKSHLLKVGALPEPPADNYSTVFPQSVNAHGIAFRDTLPAVTQWMRSLRPEITGGSPADSGAGGR